MKFQFPRKFLEIICRYIPIALVEKCSIIKCISDISGTIYCPTKVVGRCKTTVLCPALSSETTPLQVQSCQLSGTGS